MTYVQQQDAGYWKADEETPDAVQEEDEVYDHDAVWNADEDCYEVPDEAEEYVEERPTEVMDDLTPACIEEHWEYDADEEEAALAAFVEARARRDGASPGMVSNWMKNTSLWLWNEAMREDELSDTVTPKDPFTHPHNTEAVSYPLSPQAEDVGDLEGLSRGEWLQIHRHEKQPAEAEEYGEDWNTPRPTEGMDPLTPVWMRAEEDEAGPLAQASELTSQQQQGQQLSQHAHDLSWGLQVQEMQQQQQGLWDARPGVPMDTSAGRMRDGRRGGPQRADNKVCHHCGRLGHIRAWCQYRAEPSARSRIRGARSGVPPPPQPKAKVRALKFRARAHQRQEQEQEWDDELVVARFVSAEVLPTHTPTGTRAGVAFTL